MFEYVIHGVYFDKKGYPHDNENFKEIVCDSLEDAFTIVDHLKTYDLTNHDFNKGYYIEHRIKLEVYAKCQQIKK